MDWIITFTHTRSIPKSHSLDTLLLYQDEMLITGHCVSLVLYASTCAQCRAEILSLLSGVVMKLLADARWHQL